MYYRLSFPLEMGEVWTEIRKWNVLGPIHQSFYYAICAYIFSPQTKLVFTITATNYTVVHWHIWELRIISSNLFRTGRKYQPSYINSVPMFTLLVHLTYDILCLTRPMHMRTWHVEPAHWQLEPTDGRRQSSAAGRRRKPITCLYDATHRVASCR